MKGIILAGGSGTRLYPLTISTSKQLLPVYDKPMVFYPLSVLMDAGIRDVLIISTPADIGKFEKLLGDGSDLGIRISYAVQPSPDGLAQAFIIGKEFIGGEPCAMILGDNLFCGEGFGPLLRDAAADAAAGMSTIFGYRVKDPQRFGVVGFDAGGNVTDIEEKPKNPKSDYAVTGLYFYSGDVSELAETIVPSDRGELEITDLNGIYLRKGTLKVKLLDDSFRWWDTGTFDSLMEASEYVRDCFAETGFTVDSPEHAAYEKGWISKEKLLSLADRYGKSPYGAYLRRIAGAERDGEDNRHRDRDRRAEGHRTEGVQGFPWIFLRVVQQKRLRRGWHMLRFRPGQPVGFVKRGPQRTPFPDKPSADETGAGARRGGLRRRGGPPQGKSHVREVVRGDPVRGELQAVPDTQGIRPRVPGAQREGRLLLQMRRFLPSERRGRHHVERPGHRDRVAGRRGDHPQRQGQETPVPEGPPMSRTVVVTGGAGFIGSNFIFHMRKEHPEDRIVCMDSLTYAGNIETLKGVMGDDSFVFSKTDIRDRPSVERVIGEYSPDCIVNFAAESHVDRSIKDPQIFLETNIIGTSVLMDVAVEHGVKRFHQVSTDEVYGDLPLDRKDLLFTEETPLHTSSPYSSSKAGADLLAMAYGRTYGLPVTISRCSNNYGPYQFPEKLIPLMATKALNGERLPVYGDGLNVRDWLYVEDHCRAVDLILGKGRPGQVYNVGGNNEKANIDIVKYILSYLGKPESLIEYVEDRKGHDRRYAIDASKIRRELGWAPETDFASGIAKTVGWYLANREWTARIADGSYLRSNSEVRSG